MGVIRQFIDWATLGVLLWVASWVFGEAVRNYVLNGLAFVVFPAKWGILPIAFLAVAAVYHALSLAKRIVDTVRLK